MAVEPAGQQRLRRWRRRGVQRADPDSDVAITRRNRRARGDAAPELRSGGRAMFYWLLLLVALAVATGILGFGGVTHAATEIGQILFAIAVGLLVATLIVGAVRSRAE